MERDWIMNPWASLFFFSLKYNIALNEFARACAIKSHQLSMILLGLEMKHVITSLPGGVVELVHDIRHVNRGADE